jgi:hypothetical protein
MVAPNWQNALIKKYIFGNRRVNVGSWNAAGVTGGDIDTKLKRVEMCLLVHQGSAVEAAVAVVNETFPLAGGDVTIVATSGDTGYWMAVGK